MNEVISMPLMGLSAKSESLTKWLMAACLAIGLLSQKSFAAKYETEANIAKISHADSVIIFTNTVGRLQGLAVFIILSASLYLTSASSNFLSLIRDSHKETCISNL